MVRLAVVPPTCLYAYLSRQVPWTWLDSLSYPNTVHMIRLLSYLLTYRYWTYDSLSLAEM